MRYSDQERAEKQSKVEALLAEGQSRLAACKAVGITRATYDKWIGANSEPTLVTIPLEPAARTHKPVAVLYGQPEDVIEALKGLMTSPQ